jgi:L-alanine-DL-glutamate epimerase-like enolase superfamily enzyme
MKITEVHVFPVSIPYRKPFQLATGLAREGKHVIVKIFTDQGIVGVGEAAVIIPDRTGESQEAITLAIRNVMGPMIIGEDPFQIDRIMGTLEGVSHGKFGMLYSKCAIDHALYDLMGKALGVPVCQLIGGCGRKTLRIGKAIGIGAPEEMADRAVEFKTMGFQSLTVKGSREPKADILRVGAVRKAVGDDFPLELDPNQGYPAHAAIRALRAMEAYNLEMVEQPCPWWDWDGMAAVTAAIDTPIAADEMVMNLVDAMQVVKRRAADIITLKLVKSGGIYFSKKIAAVAEAGGLGCSIGSMHTFGVGTAAIHHFSSATKEVDDPIGYGSPLDYYTDDIVTEPVQLVDGTITVSEKPGLGVELDEAKLKKYGVEIRVN